MKGMANRQKREVHPRKWKPMERLKFRKTRRAAKKTFFNGEGRKEEGKGEV